MATRKTNGEGSIYYSESKNLYEGKVTVGIEPNGKLIRKSVYGKKKSEVVQKMNKLNHTNRSKFFLMIKIIIFNL